MMFDGMFRFARGVWADRSGFAAIEMAVAVPVLAGLLLSGVEITRYVLLNQKIDRASATMADLVSQAEGLREPDLSSIFIASSHALEPFDLATSGRVIVSSISTSGVNPPFVNWQRSFGAGGGASAFGVEGGDASLPAGFSVRDGESVIVAEAFFDFVPIFVPAVTPPSTVYRYSFLRPRFDSLTTITP